MISLLQFDGFAIPPDGIQFGEAESREFTKQDGLALQKFKASRPSITITITGVTDTDVTYYQSAAEAGSDLRDSISYGGRSLSGCRLISAEVAGFLQVGDTQVVDTLALLYESNTWTHVSPLTDSKIMLLTWMAFNLAMATQSVSSMPMQE